MQKEQETYHDDLTWHQRTVQELNSLVESWKFHVAQQGSIALDKEAKLVRILQFEISQRLLELTLEADDNADSILQQHFNIDDETLTTLKEKFASLCSHITDPKDQLVIYAQFLKLHKEFPHTFAHLDDWQSLFKGQTAATCRDLLIFLRQFNAPSAAEEKVKKDFKALLGLHPKVFNDQLEDKCNDLEVFLFQQFTKPKQSHILALTKKLIREHQAPAVLAIAAALETDLDQLKVLSFLQSLDTLDQAASYDELMQVLTIYKKLTPAARKLLDGFSHISQVGLMTLLQFQQGQDIDGLLGLYKQCLQATLGDFRNSSEFNMAIGSGLPAFSRFLQIPRIPTQVDATYASIKDTLSEYEIVTERAQVFTLLLNNLQILPLARPYLSKGITGNDFGSAVAHLEEWDKLSEVNREFLTQKIEETFGISALVSQGMIQPHHIPMIYSEVLTIWDQSLLMTFPELNTLEYFILLLGGFRKDDALLNIHKGQTDEEIIQQYRGENSAFLTLTDDETLAKVQNEPMFLRHHISYANAWDAVVQKSFIENILSVVSACIEGEVEKKTLKPEDFITYLKTMPIAFKVSPEQVFELHGFFAWPESLKPFDTGVLFGWVADYYFTLVNIERLRALEGKDDLPQEERAQIVKGVFAEQGDPEKGRWSDLKMLADKLVEEGLSGFNVAKVLQSAVDSHTDVKTLLARAQNIDIPSLDMEDKVISLICLGQVAESRFSFIQNNVLFWPLMKDFSMGNLIYMASRMNDEQWDMFTSEVPDLTSYANFMMAHPPRHQMPDFMRSLQKWA